MAVTDNEGAISRVSLVRAGAAPSPLPSVSLGRDHITEALKNSPDNGATLDLTHKSLTDVGEDGASELAYVGQANADGESAVVRIALAHNRLTTLPMAFALLTRLRYLVLKNNNFTIFPDVLTVMPSLEILDMSRNKIKRLPSQPGSLIKLRVFSLSRNKIHRLPTYFTQFQNLNIFKVDQNPLEWPPRDIMEPASQSEHPDAAKAWIRSIQKWIELDSINAERKHGDEHDASYADMDHDSFADEIRDNIMDARSPFDMSLFVEGSSTSQHQRTFSLDSDQSNYSDNMLPMPSIQTSRSPRSPRPPRLHLDAVSSSRSVHISPSRSPDSYLPTPEESVSSTDEDVTGSTVQLHGRNASFAGSGGSAQRSVLTAKKSMPNLRPAKLHLNHHREVPLHIVNEKSGIPSPPHRQESDSSNGSLQNFRTPKFSLPGLVSSPVSLHRPAPHMDGARHKYFRRISTLNLGSLKTVPPALLTVVDGIRGILFGISQIYQALQHYTEYAIDERFSSVLLKVLDPASMYMNQLIQALDRFDAMSRRTLPSPAVCRAVVETCRDNVNMFGKAVGVLTLQLKVLATHDDVRYTRQMLLVLYGAMAEIVGAWTAIAGQIEAVKRFLRELGPPPATKAYPVPSSILDVTAPSTPGSVTPTPSLPNSRINPRSPTNGASDARARMARRHAGSFSFKDVEIGMLLPSNADSPPFTSGIVGGPTSSTPIPRTIRRAATTFAGTTRDPLHNDGTIRPSTSAKGDLHSRQSSASSLLASSTSSPALPFAKSPPMETMSNAHTQIDGVAVDAIQKAVEAAPPVWILMEQLLRQDSALHETLNDTLRKAEDVTGRLQDDIRNVGTDFAHRMALRDDAHVFANTVIQLLSAIKTYGATHALSSDLRNNMVQLTQATQDFVMLLHVSSFSPTSTPRPYSPMVGAIMSPPPLPLQEDGRLGANLSRSRSAITAVVTRNLPPMKEPPRSALPHGTFMLSPARSPAVTG